MDTEINELHKILDRIARNMIATKNNDIDNKCCRMGADRHYDVVMVHSYRDFMYAINLCRLAFVLISSMYCPYCHMFRHVFTRIAKLYADRAMFIEVSADHMPEIPAMFNVYSTPTTIVMLEGRPIDVIVGYIPFNSFNSYVNEMLKRVGCLDK